MWTGLMFVPSSLVLDVAQKNEAFSSPKCHLAVLNASFTALK